MTRKRFVKLCMANGYSRNAANRIAEEISAKGKTYAETYKGIVAINTLSKWFGREFRDTVDRLSKSFGKLTKALSEGVAAFSKAVSAAMTEE